MPVEHPGQKIGVVEYSLPRAVQLTKPNAEDVRDVEMAIFGTFAIRVDTATERERLISRWPDIIQHLSNGIETLLGEDE